MIDWTFVLESLKLAKNTYIDKANKYLYSARELPDLEYKEKILDPKLKQFDENIAAIQKLKQILTEPEIALPKEASS